MYRENPQAYPEYTGDVLMDVKHTNRILVVFADSTQVHLGEVDCIQRGSVVDVLCKRLGDFNTNHSLGFFGGSANVRGQDQVLACQQLRIVVKVRAVGSRLLGEDINTSTSKTARLKRLCESRNLNNSATRIVQQISTLLHLLELMLANHVLGVFGFRNMQTDIVSNGQELIEALQRLGLTKRHDLEHIVKVDCHTHRFSQDRQLSANVAITNDAQDLATDLVTCLGDLVPDTLVHLHIAIAQLTGKHDDFTNDKLGNGTGVTERRVEHSNLKSCQT